MERLEIGRRIVREALLPTAIEHTDPCAGQGAHRRLVGVALVALLLVIDVGPAGRPDRFRGPCHERLSEEGRTLQAPGPPGWLATAFRDRCDARILLEFRGGGAAFSLCTEGHAEARGKDRAGPWQGVQQREVGMGVGTLCPRSVEVGKGVQGHAEWGDQGVPQEGMGGDHAVSRGQCHSVRDRRTAGRDDVGRTYVVGTAKALQGGATCEWGGLQGRPAAAAVAKDRRLLVLKPLQDVGEGVFERTRQALRPPACVADEALAVCNEWRHGAPRGAWRAKGGAFVTVFAQEVDLACGIGGGLCGPARGQRFTVRGHGERSDGKKPEAIIVLQRRHHRTFIACQADGKRLAVAPRAPGAAPGVDHCRPVVETQQLPARRAGAWEANIVCGIRPGPAYKGRKCCGGLGLHGGSPRV